MTGAGAASAQLRRMLESGLAQHKAGRLAEAETCYRSVLAADAGHADALHWLGLLALQRGRAAEAAELIGRALARAPHSPTFLNNRGLALAELGAFADAVASFDTALRLRPDYGSALSNRGSALHRLGRNAEALTSLDRAIALQADVAEMHVNRGLVLADLGREAEALAAHERAIALRPDYAQAHSNRGNVLLALGRPAEALASLDRAVALRPDMADLHTNRGNALRDVGQPEAAVAAHTRAIALRPDHAEAHCNFGRAMIDLNRYAPALASLDRALALKPALAEARMNRAVIALVQGRLAEGFADYEVRWQTQAFARGRRGFAQPQWQGEALAGRTLLLHADQGLGDSIQFCRYVTLVLARADGPVILEAPRALLPLFQGTFPGLRLVMQNEALPAFDLHCPLPSLPHVFGTELASVPAPVGYLRADPVRAAQWRDRLESAGPPRVGLVWSGDPKHANDHCRSLPLARLLPLAQCGARLFGLQPQVRPADRAVLAATPAIADLGRDFADFADTAAAIAALDLVISVDTSVAHLAAALGKPTWVMLPFCPDWRWLLEREDSPWYPTLRLFRQPARNDWDSVLRRVQAALADHVAGRDHGAV